MVSKARPADLSIALNRFGLGARYEEAPPSEARAFLLDQFNLYQETPSPFASARSASEIFADFARARQDLRAMDEAPRMAAGMRLRKRGRRLYRDEVEMRVISALVTRAPFIERLVHFWSNHFAISADKPELVVLAGAFEREVIRPHVLGRFEDMLVAAEQHPAMQIFLDQVSSIGPGSSRAKRDAKAKKAKQRGVNENLAREILELHTLGARSGYTQKDVTEFALALTGWSVTRSEHGRPGSFLFKPQWHEPGERVIISKVYPQDGDGQARAVLAYLAKAEATATHLATKLARHFIADDPPSSAVEKLKISFLETSGDLPSVYRTLIDMPEAWDPRPRKFKTPWEWIISALRGLGWTEPGNVDAAQLLRQLGQPAWQPRSPAGYDDVAASWVAPDALMRRVKISQRLALTANVLDARSLARNLQAGTLSDRTLAEVSRADSVIVGTTLVLVSPEFQRR
ncbi:uncharacterized protein (DUF1800 family) [Sinorhizobium terangae]|uniref:DUF1800 domain-containing protein n=1 Tax=Sinorhizobium terangae TaxID=110322 RepID=UPI00180F2E17|nr:uncharacterized protein (DUF1800 family) [Sinorhizobium terangae]